MNYKTVTLPTVIPNPYSRYAILTANLWRVGVVSVWKYMCENPIKVFESLRKFKAETYQLAYKYIPYKYYAEKCSEFVYEFSKSLLAIAKFNVEESEDPYEWYVSKLPLIEFDNWKMFESRGDKYQSYGNGGIKLVELGKARIKLFKSYNNYIDVEVKYKLPRSRKWVKVLDLLIEKVKNHETHYDARLYINGYRDGKVFAQIQVAIPTEIWNSVEPIITINPYPTDKSLGVDVNSDRINFMLINEDGKILDKYTLWFKNLKNIHGYRRHDLIGYFGQKLPKILREFLRYGKFVTSIEDPEVIGFLKLKWVKVGDRKSNEYNFKISTFASWVIEFIEKICQKLGIYTIRVNPGGTTHSKEHEEVMKRLGLDRHMASAYLIAKRGLEKLKQII